MSRFEPEQKRIRIKADCILNTFKYHVSCTDGKILVGIIIIFFLPIFTYGAETWKFNKQLESKLMSMEMTFWGDRPDVQDYSKLETMLLEKKMSIKNPGLDYIRYKPLIWYSTCKGWTKKGSLEEF